MTIAQLECRHVVVVVILPAVDEGGLRHNANLSALHVLACKAPGRQAQFIQRMHDCILVCVARRMRDLKNHPDQNEAVKRQAISVLKYLAVSASDSSHSVALSSPTTFSNSVSMLVDFNNFE